MPTDSSYGIVIENLAEFRRDLKRAVDATPRELTKAIRAMGAPVLSELAVIVARRRGRLVKGYRIQVRGTSGSVINREPYALGAEWGMHGKWKGFQKYGGRGRFAWRAVTDQQEAIARIGLEQLEDIVTIHGWAR